MPGLYGVWLCGWLIPTYTVSAANAQLCPDARRGRQPRRCRLASAPPYFTLGRTIYPQRPSVVWLLSRTMYIASLEVTCLPVLVFLKLFSFLYAVLEASYV